MNSMWPSHKNTSYSSVKWHESKALSGVRYSTRRISLFQRIELANRLRQLLLQHEFLKAGDTSERVEATLGELLAQRMYLEWGVADVEGLTIDEGPATLQEVIEKGPEALTQEMLTAVQSELELSEEERKNF